jgi:hypothetical protein
MKYRILKKPTCGSRDYNYKFHVQFKFFFFWVTDEWFLDQLSALDYYNEKIYSKKKNKEKAIVLVQNF